MLVSTGERDVSVIGLAEFEHGAKVENSGHGVRPSSWPAASVRQTEGKSYICKCTVHLGKRKSCHRNIRSHLCRTRDHG